MLYNVQKIVFINKEGNLKKILEIFKDGPKTFEYIIFLFNFVYFYENQNKI